jgi:hypothetical protein
MLEPKKTFIGFPTIQLLDQQVDSLGMVGEKQKLAVIASIALARYATWEIFLGITDATRDYIPQYAATLVQGRSGSHIYGNKRMERSTIIIHEG